MVNTTDLSGKKILSQATEILKKSAKLVVRAEHALLRSKQANSNQQPKV